MDVAGPFAGYVKNKDLTKQLDVVPGSTVYLGPKDDAGVLCVFDKGDKAEITGLHGTWTQVRLDKTLVGYIAENRQAPVAPRRRRPCPRRRRVPLAPPASSASSPAPAQSAENAAPLAALRGHAGLDAHASYAQAPLRLAARGRCRQAHRLRRPLASSS